MKKIVIGIFVAIIAPIMLNAGGIGIYVPYIASGSSSGTYYPDSYSSYDTDYSYDLKSSSGFGITLSTNLGKEAMFGYSLALELTHPHSENSSVASDLYEMLHTFEFGVVNTEVVKVWIGPRINIGVRSHDTYSNSQSGFQVGIAPAVGVNVNIGNYFAIIANVDYKFAVEAGSDTYGSYDETRNALTARVGVVLKFGEEYY